MSWSEVSKPSHSCKVQSKIWKYVYKETGVFSGLYSRSHCGCLHCNGSTELNEQMGCIVGLLCCVKIKGLLYFLFFIVEQVLLLLEELFCFTVQICSTCCSGDLSSWKEDFYCKAFWLLASRLHFRLLVKTIIMWWSPELFFSCKSMNQTDLRATTVINFLADNCQVFDF